MAVLLTKTGAAIGYGNRMRNIVCLPVVVLLLPACAGTAPGPRPAVEDLGIRNAVVSADGRLLSAGQLTEEQLAALPAAGFDTIVCLRDPGEPSTGWEEAYAAEHGLRFVRIPIDGPDGLSRANAEALAQAMREAEAGTVVYCGSSNRVGGLLAVKAGLLDGLELDEALEIGRRHGMTRIEPMVRETLEKDG
jgi:protein tyrosine phosphatase (PTP) superfamily phosphohydrolase (DUF442 family)